MQVHTHKNYTYVPAICACLQGTVTRGAARVIQETFSSIRGPAITLLTLLHYAITTYLLTGFWGKGITVLCYYVPTT